MKNIITQAFIAFFMLLLIACNKSVVDKSFNASATSVQSINKVDNSIYIGAHYGGGIIYLIDSTGKHGLVVSSKDIGSPIEWGYKLNAFSGASGQRIGSGPANTKKIIRSEGYTRSYAALECAKFAGGGHTDWFLPSLYELYALYKHRNAIKGLENEAYWSSTESEKNVVWFIEFSTGGIYGGPKSNVIAVRAVRHF